MKLTVFLLALVSAAAATVVDPRGARPVVPNTRSEKCATQKEWPFCTDEEWGPKCPSGCRMQGLLEKFDHDFSKRIEKIRGLVNQNQAKHRAADQVSKQTHDYLREKLTIGSDLDNNYFDMAQTLRQRISEMKIKIDQQLLVLRALKDKVQDQVQDMKKLEVDIDMKLRSCKGSCKTYHNYAVDHDEHVALEKQMNQLDTVSGQTVQSVGTLHVMKSRPLKDAVVDSVFKSSDPQTAQQTTDENLFPEVKTVQLFLDIEGSTSFPATISKVPVCLRWSQPHRSDRKSPPPPTCGEKKLLPLCSDDDTESRCPSGCRLHGLMEERGAELGNKLRNICEKSRMVREAAGNMMSTTAQVYHRDRRAIIRETELQAAFVEHAETLSKNLTLLWKRSQSLETHMTELREKVREQLKDLLRAEVDVDILLRSCLGSCRSVVQVSMMPRELAELRSQTEQTLSSSWRSHAASQWNILEIQTAPMDLGPEPNPVYKTIKTVLSEGLDLFEDLPQTQLLLREQPQNEL